MSEQLKNCQNCQAACCRGYPLLIMSLADEELVFMNRGGNRFQTIEKPAGHDRENVRYPAGAYIYPEKGTIQYIYEAGRSTEPLPANYGRYALLGDCQYLATDQNGWEYCSVYEERPQVCRDFEMGSPKCLSLRLLAGVDQP